MDHDHPTTAGRSESHRRHRVDAVRRQRLSSDEMGRAASGTRRLPGPKAAAHGTVSVYDLMPSVMTFMQSFQAA